MAIVIEKLLPFRTKVMIGTSSMYIYAIAITNTRRDETHVLTVSNKV